MALKIDFTGQKFGKLTAKFSYKENGIHTWHCICECGNTREVKSSALKRTASCGCSKIDIKYLAKIKYSKHGKKHGLESHWLYNTWLGMLRRCYKKDDNAYKFYGAKGIEVFNDWLQNPAGFITFMESIGATKKHGYSVDRIDYNDGYFPWNIRWATDKQQANNTSKNRILILDGISLTMAQWAEKLGIPYGRLQTRIQRGWDVRRALSIN